jgi:hypothetical protein
VITIFVYHKAAGIIYEIVKDFVEEIVETAKPNIVQKIVETAARQL